MSVNLTSSLISTLGNTSSKVPLAVKDITNSLGMTYQSYKAGGNLEGKDRFIDEFGTQAIWLFGIPVFQTIINKTLYKAMGYNPDVDIRVVASKDKNIVKQAIDNAPTQQIKNDIIKASENLPTFKKLFYGKFAAATVLTLASYFALTKVKQNFTKKQVEKDFNKKIENADKERATLAQKRIDSNPTFRAFGSAAKKGLSFGSLQSFMFDPVKNMLIIDSGITAERLAHSRTKGEFAEYALKEGSFIFFMYCAGKLLQDGIESISAKLFKTPIDLDAKFLASDELKTSLENGTTKTDLDAFKKLVNTNMAKPKTVLGKLAKAFGFDKEIQTADTKVINEFLQNNPNNIVTKMLKKSGIVQTVSQSDKITGAAIDLIDTSKYISEKTVKNSVNSFEELFKAFKNSNLSASQFVNKTKGFKVASVVVNVGLCCLIMGYTLPKMIIEYRKRTNQGNKDFHVAKEYETKLEEQYKNNNLYLK